jgi:hypothetical protein
VALHVVHPDNRHVKRPGQAAGSCGTDEQCADQSATAGVGNSIDFLALQARLQEQLIDERNQLAHMVT